MGQDTLLLRFIRKQLSNATLEISRPKLKSVLLHLSSLRGTDIAEFSGVPYGTFRVWRTERRYLELIKQHVTRFSDIVVDRLVEQTLKNTVIIDGTEGKEAGIVLSDDIFLDLRDIVLFNERVLEEILSRADAATLPQDASKGYPLLMKKTMTMDVIPYLWAIRKGDVAYTGQGFSWQEGSPRVISEGAGLLRLVTSLSKPWNPRKEVMHSALAQFIAHSKAL